MEATARAHGALEHDGGLAALDELLERWHELDRRLTAALAFASDSEARWASMGETVADAVHEMERRGDTDAAWALAELAWAEPDRVAERVAELWWEGTVDGRLVEAFEVDL